MKTFLFFLATLPCLVVTITSAAFLSKSIFTATGREIPLHAIRMRLPNVPVEHVHTKVFEIRDQRYLHGHVGHVDLHARAPKLKQIHSNPKLIVRINGIEERVKSVQGFLRHGNGYIVSHNLNGEILSIWAEGLSLSALSRTEHPGIFVNTKRSNATVHMEDAAHNLLDPNIFDIPEDLMTDFVVSGTEGHINTELVQADSFVTSIKATSCSDATVPRVAEIAIAIDNTLCENEFGNDVENAKIGLMNFLAAVELSYSANTCVRFSMTYLDGHCKDSHDPYTRLKGKRSIGILRSFRRMWQKEPYTNVQRDYALFIPGFSDGTDVSGSAYLGVICSTRAGFGWSEGLSVSTTVHEVAHSFNCDHSSEGIMRPTITFDNPRNLFSALSVSEIVSFVDAYASRCMSYGTVDKPTDTGTPHSPTVPPSTYIPTGAPGTCAAGFSYITSLECFSYHTNSTSEVGNFSTELICRSDQLKVVIETVPHYEVMNTKMGQLYSTYRITEVGLSLSMKNGKGVDRTVLGLPGASAVTYEWGLGSISLPAGRSTCCEDWLYVTESVKLQKTVYMFNGTVFGSPRTFTETSRFSVQFPCLTCHSPKKLVAMSQTVECPTCSI